MDPSAILCRYKNSFDNNGNVPIVLHTYKTTNEQTNNTVKNNLILSEAKKLPKSENPTQTPTQTPNQTPNLTPNQPRYCDPTLYGMVNKVNMVNNVNKIPTNLTDPFGNISPNPFLNRDAIALADIDMTFNFTKHTSGYILKQESKKDYNFVAIEDGPGGFSQYVMYRNPSSYGYGMSEIQIVDRIDMTHFNIIKSPSGKVPDITRDYRYLIKNVRTINGNGIDLVLGNYGPSDKILPSGYIIRLIVALGTLKVGGTFVSKINLNNNLGDKLNNLMMDLLYITSQCFNKITLFKPISTNLNDDIYYIVAEESKTNNIEWVSYLEEAYVTSTKENKQIINLIDNIPTTFIDWVTEYNNLILLYKKYLQEQSNLGITDLYDTYKCKAIWNLPQI